LRAINPGVKVILSSGYSNDQSSGKHLTAECPAGFIQKPYSVESLRQELTRVLKGA
jgi:DNA-binding NtrC family response regulator